MSKNLLIKVYAEETTGRVDIIGNISEWNQNNAIEMRSKCEELKAAGTTKCHVYLMTGGGDCFQANEIVNILIDVFGSYTGEGGALVASAGTYIGVRASSFIMAKNGQYMIHKPMGGAHGNETEVENYLELLKNMTVTYYEAYKDKLKKPEADFKAKWDAGDFWMTAEKAKEWGFVTEVKGDTKIDQTTASMIKESGSPIEAKVNDTPKNTTDMDVKAMATLLGMDASSTEDQVNARIQANAQKAAGYDALKAQQEQKDKDDKEAKIKAALDEAEKDKRIKADARANWQGLLEKDFDGTKAVLDSLQPVVKPLSAEIKPSADGTGATYQGKTFEQLQDENPEALAELEDKNPEAYKTLFADWKKRNRIS
ncbi:ATP-dependent Clp protease proteolytic subunit [Carboxylicivirga linearis]|uniref:ATP-dependent Clp protease proteolytic subunit n=1 Tax=Carboxylicivirga linearis TaxID=1628157 RepID=A0ABS5JWD3_9BACT|nr:ATP-dependent Clp protease proteolytic subunit [Carboxylicivirga linearis]MBS2099183.1 ATP-dependent Clp protease proteolytic subunit [Carboxylicivirga linearis]